MLRRILSILLTLTVLTFMLFSCDTIKDSAFNSKGEIVVAVDQSLPGYFELNGESYGYQYEVLKAYANEMGQALKVVSHSEARSKKVDFVAKLTADLEGNEKQNSIGIFTTSYVILGQKDRFTPLFYKTDGFSLINVLKQGRTMVSYGFSESENYDILLDSLNDSQIALSSQKSFTLIDGLDRGDYDFLICEKGEAQIGAAMTENIVQLYEFAEQVSMSLVINNRLKGTNRSFSNWISEFPKTERYAVLNHMYFNKGIVGLLIEGSTMAHNGTISEWDHLMKEVGETEGFDWRFLSAIAHTESHFKQNARSHAGATGLMQIMPIVARHFNVSWGAVPDPETNVKLAAWLLHDIERMLECPEGTSTEDKIKLTLASYNGGIGHITDAQRLAKKYGADPYKWEDVSQYLKLKRNPKYYNDRVVKCGGFVSTETVNYVDKVMNTYNNFCYSVAL